jgi:hypothetical protein
MSEENLEGGCFCGAVRFRLNGIPTDVGHCHCRMCQRASGALFLAWATVDRADLTVTAGAARWFRSSPGAQRAFCEACGTNLFFAHDGAGDIDVTIGALDTPDAVKPLRNTWVGSRRHLMKGFDADLPDFQDEGPLLD